MMTFRKISLMVNIPNSKSSTEYQVTQTQTCVLKHVEAMSHYWKSLTAAVPKHFSKLKLGIVR